MSGTFKVTVGGAFDPNNAVDLISSVDGKPLSQRGDPPRVFDRYPSNGDPALDARMGYDDPPGGITPVLHDILYGPNTPLTVKTGGIFADFSTSAYGVFASATDFGSRIIGSAQVDLIYGGLGHDSLTGGAGADVFSDWSLVGDYGSSGGFALYAHDFGGLAYLDGDTLTDLGTDDIVELRYFHADNAALVNGELTLRGFQNNFARTGGELPGGVSAALTLRTPGFSGATVNVNAETLIVETGQASYTYLNTTGRLLDLIGTSAPDSITTGPTQSTVTGPGVDTVLGMNGDDVITAGTGGGMLFGNRGADRFQFSAGSGAATVFGGKDNDVIDARTSVQANYLSGDLGDDTVYGGSGADIVLGLNGDDVITAGSGRAQLFGNQGADRILLGAGAGDSTVFGGRGDDLIDARGSTAEERLHGDLGNDSIFAGSGNASLWGGLGSDTLTAGTGGLDIVWIAPGDSTAGSGGDTGSLDRVIGFVGASSNGNTTGVLFAFYNHANGSTANVLFDPATEAGYAAAYAYAYGSGGAGGHLGGGIEYVVASDAAGRTYIFTTDAAVELEPTSPGAAPVVHAGDIYGYPT